MTAKRSPSRWWLASLPGAVIFAFVFFIMPFSPVGRPLLVASGTLSCGEVLLTQTFTGTPDPYFVSFYFRPTGTKAWEEYYVDDESPYWRGTVRVESSGDSCSVTFYGTKELSFTCGAARLVRRHGIDTFARARVENPLARAVAVPRLRPW